MDITEDITDMSSDDILDSEIEELKEEYKDGRIQKLEDIFYDALENLRGYRW